MLIGPYKTERARIREHGGVEARRHLGSERYLCRANEFVHHLTGGTRVFFDPIHVGEGFGAVVVIDVDEQAVAGVDARYAGALDRVTFEDDGCLIPPID